MLLKIYPPKNWIPSFAGMTKNSVTPQLSFPRLTGQSMVFDLSYTPSFHLTVTAQYIVRMLLRIIFHPS